MPWWRLPVYLRWICILLLLDEMFYQYQFNQADWWHNQVIYILTNILLGASLVAQLLKNPPAMQETQVQLLALEVSLKKG